MWGNLNLIIGVGEKSVVEVVNDVMRYARRVLTAVQYVKKTDIKCWKVVVWVVYNNCILSLHIYLCLFCQVLVIKILKSM